MIITVLRGGLGNQLFQYAFARILAERHQTQLYLDKTFYLKHDHRNYELNNFKIKVNGLLCFDAFGETEVIARRHGIPLCVVDYGQHSIDEITALGPDIVLSGEWSSRNAYLFEEHNKLLIQQEIQLNGAMGHDRVRALIEQSENPVCVQVRRGDYDVLLDTYRLLAEEYYDIAFDFIEKTVCSPEFFVFSDDIELIKHSLRFRSKVTYVNNVSPTHDLALSRQCKHFVCANSTFSWWSAYLGEKYNSMVIFPMEYYTKKELQEWYESSSEYLRNSWLRV
jgi:Glycosyl transferase family 11